MQVVTRTANPRQKTCISCLSGQVLSWLCHCPQRENNCPQLPTKRNNSLQQWVARLHGRGCIWNVNMYILLG